MFNDPEWGNAVDLQATLPTNSPYVSITNSNIYYGDIPPGEAMIIEPFIMSISDEAPETDIEFEMHILSNQNGYIEYTKTIPLTYSIIAPEIMLGDLNQDEIIQCFNGPFHCICGMIFHGYGQIADPPLGICVSCEISGLSLGAKQIGIERHLLCSIWHQ